MKFPTWLHVAGDTSFRGKCKPEVVEQIEFFARLRRELPALAAIAVHPRNEGKRSGRQGHREKLEGMTPGASDIVIPCSPPIIIELKRRDHTQSRWQAGQLDYLAAAKAAGAVVCVALGAEAAMDFVQGLERKQHGGGSEKL